MPLAVMGLLACNDSGTNSNTQSQTIGADPVTLSITQDVAIQQTATYYLKQTKECKVNGVYSETWDDTTYFQLGGGQLLTWSMGECFADIATGSSTTLNGTWTATGTYVNAPNASAASCYAQDTSSSGSTVSATAKFTNTNIHMVGSLQNYCWTTEMVDPTSIIYKAVGCNKYTATYGDTVATFTLNSIDLQSKEVEETFSYNGQECKLHVYPDLEPSTSTCAQAWTDYIADSTSSTFYFENYSSDPRTTTNVTAFATCVRATGYTGGMLSKKMVGTEANAILQDYKDLMKLGNTGF